MNMKATLPLPVQKSHRIENHLQYPYPLKDKYMIETHTLPEEFPGSFLAGKEYILLKIPHAVSNDSQLLEYNDCMTQHRSEEHTSELQSRQYLVCRLLLEKKKQYNKQHSRC